VFVDAEPEFRIPEVSFGLESTLSFHSADIFLFSGHEHFMSARNPSEIADFTDHFSWSLCKKVFVYHNCLLKRGASYFVILFPLLLSQFFISSADRSAKESLYS